MDGQSRPAFEQGNGPSTNQPYHMPQRSPTSQEGAPIPYPQYSYDIQMRYSEDPNRQQYPEDPSRQYPPPPSRYPDPTTGQQDVPRQYAQGPTSPYPKDPSSHYSSPSPYSPVPQQQQSPQGPGQGVQLPSLSMSMQNQGQGYGNPQQEMAIDTTGQVAPAGMKPRVTATLWEDEGTLCFQVDVKGTCVARREDNHMVNGTKLLNVAGMTRGRRDGILKAEKLKHVVKIGPMHLKGVWIPYERALAFANKEAITPLLYPIFVHNIGALLYHPINHSRGPSGGNYPPPSAFGNSTEAIRNVVPRGNEQYNQNSPQPPYSPQHGLPPPHMQSPPLPPPTNGAQGEAVMFNTAREHVPRPGLEGERESVR